MTIKEFLKYAIEKLKNSGMDTPVLEAGVILCHVLKKDRTYLYSHDDRILKNAEIEALQAMLEQRMQHIPLQYLTGKTEFMSLPICVTPAVLIPRQDTELLAEKCIELVKAIEKSGVSSARIPVLDMCTGSGCIGISIAYYCSNAAVTACDISADALEIAMSNGSINGVGDKLEFMHSDLFEAIEAGRRFDIIVSNPPYIETSTISQLQTEVGNYEPKLALDGGSDGLKFYREIVNMAPKYLNKEGFLLFEIGYNQGQAVKELMQQAKFSGVEIYKDLGGNDRVVAGRLSIVPDPQQS